MPLTFRTGKRGIVLGGELTLGSNVCGCRCCNSDEASPDPGIVRGLACRFNHTSKIQNYFYTRSFPGGGRVTYEGTRDFPKVPLSDPPPPGPANQRCEFCQEYLETQYDIHDNITSQRVVADAGQVAGFRYTLCGWWDGNEAPGGTLGQPFDGTCVLSNSGGINQGTLGTYFGCGICHGWVRVRYYYIAPNPSVPAGDFADVEFYVYNPDCAGQEY